MSIDDLENIWLENEYTQEELEELENPCWDCPYWQDISNENELEPKMECVLPSNKKCPYGIK